MSHDEPVQVKFSIGDLRYFFKEGKQRGRKAAFYIGPTNCSDGVHRHITTILDGETWEIDNLHLTRESRLSRIQKWSKNPNRIESEIATWIMNNSISLEAPNADILDRDYHAISGWRVLVGFRVFMGLTRILEWVVFWPLSHMGVFQFSMSEDTERKAVRVIGRIDLTRMLQIARKFRPFKTIAQGLIPVVVTKLGPRLTRLAIKKASGISTGDISFLVPRRDGLLPTFVVRSKKYLQLDAGKVFEKIGSLYEEMELREPIPNPEKIIASGSSIPFLFESNAKA